ncbi:hypothetical protein JMUB7554_27490 [Staphylococcus aureus]
MSRGLGDVYKRQGLLGEDSKKFKSDVYGDLDAFLVIEEEPVKGRQYSIGGISKICLLYTSRSPRDTERSRMPSSA